MFEIKDIAFSPPKVLSLESNHEETLPFLAAEYPSEYKSS